MGFYLELYCDTPQCPYGRSEEGVQGTNRATICKEAKQAGWRKVGKRWLCDECVEASNGQS